MRDCVSCGAPFDPHSLAKRLAGGRINTCPDCSDEPAVKYLGLSAGDGKQGSLTVLKFDSAEDREEYRQAWWVNSGGTVGKSCQLGIQKRTPNVRFQKVHESGHGMNHKGRL